MKLSPETNGIVAPEFTFIKLQLFGFGLMEVTIFPGK